MIATVKTPSYVRTDRTDLLCWWLNVLCCSFVLLAATGCSREARRDWHLARADSYFKKGDFEAARIEYLNALRRDPTSVAAFRGLSVIYFERGSFSAAIPFLLRAQELAPEDLQVRLRLGRIYCSASKFDEARKEAEFILSKEPSNQDALFVLSEVAKTPEQAADVQQRIEALRQKMGDKASFEVALAALHMHERRWAETEDALQQAIRLEPKSATAHLALGNFFWLKNDLPQAGRELKVAAELEPANSNIPLRYAEFQLSIGSIEEAKSFLEKMTAKTPEYVPAWNLLAQIALQQKNYEDCLRLIQKVLTIDTLDYEALLLRSRVELARNQVDDAIKDLEELDARYPDVPQVKYQLAEASLLKKDFLKATTNLERAVAINPNFNEASLLLAEIKIGHGAAASAAESLGNLIKRQPQLARAYFLLAEANLTLGKSDDALAVLQRMPGLFPKDPQVPFETGLVLRLKNKAADARAAFLRTLELAPAFHSAAEQLVDMDLKDRNVAGALAQAQRQAQNEPRAPEPQLLLARVYLAQNEKNQAEAALLKAIELDPGCRPGYLALAGLYMQSKKPEEALGKLDALLARDPHDMLALTSVAAIHESRRDYARAAETYKKILEVDPQTTLALNNLAYLYAERLGQLDKGYELATKARQLLPQNALVEDTLGWIRYKRGEYAQALELLEESAAKLPDNPEALCHLGMARYMMGREESARLAFRQALQTGQDFPGRDAATERLALLDMDSGAGEKALAALEKRLAVQPNDPVTLTRLGAVCEQLGRWEKARDAYEAVLRVNSDSADVMARLALIYGRSGDPKKGLELAKAARKQAPADPFVAHALGKLAWQNGDHGWAVSLLQESNLGQPGRPAVLYDLALAYFSVARVQDAEAAMRSALQADPNFPSAEAGGKFLALLELLKKPGDYQQAESQAEAVLQNEPDNLPALMLLAVTREKQRRLDEARHAYESILARYPHFALAAKRLSILYFEHFGEEQKALELAAKARETLSDDPELAALLGKIAFRRKDYERSVQLLEQAARDGRADAEVFYYLGLSYHGLDHFAECRQALQKALALNDKDVLAEEARQILTKLP